MRDMDRIADVRIPLDAQAEMAKARKSKESCVDSDKIRAADEQVAAESGQSQESETAEDKKKRLESQDCVGFRAATNTMARERMLGKSQSLPGLAELGVWMHLCISAGHHKVDDLAKSVRGYFEKAAGASLVMGMPATDAAVSKAAYARIVALNVDIQECLDKDETATDLVVQAKLRKLYEDLAKEIMRSEGLGLKTEDMIPADPAAQDTAFKSPHVVKSQAAPDISLPTGDQVGVVVEDGGLEK